MPTPAAPISKPQVPGLSLSRCRPLIRPKANQGKHQAPLQGRQAPGLFVGQQHGLDQVLRGIAIGKTTAQAGLDDDLDGHDDADKGGNGNQKGEIHGLSPLGRARAARSMR